MKKLIIFSLLGLILIYILLPKYEFTHYKLSSKNIFVTKVEYSSIIFVNSTYFTAGKYCNKAIPESFVQPVYSGIDGGYDIILSSENGIINIYGFNGYFETNNLKSDINFQEINSDLDGVKKWKTMVNDSSGKYIHVFY